MEEAKELQNFKQQKQAKDKSLLQCQSQEQESIDLQSNPFDQDISQPQQPQVKKKIKKNPESDSSDLENIFDDNVILDKLPLEKAKLQEMLVEVNARIRDSRTNFFAQQQALSNKKSPVGDNAVPICADITKFDFQKLISKQLQIANRQFDVIMMDPPWRLSSSQPSRGVAIQYNSLSDELIQQIPVCDLQKQGFLFVWVINAKFQWTVNTMEKKWGYKVIDSINWVKKTVNGKIAKGHGFYLQHAKETCLVGYKGNMEKFKGNVSSDIIFSDRRGQSQKPTEIYQYIEELVPQGYYLEIFGRRNNLRNRWVTVGNQL